MASENQGNSPSIDVPCQICKMYSHQFGYFQSMYDVNQNFINIMSLGFLIVVDCDLFYSEAVQGQNNVNMGPEGTTRVQGKNSQERK